MISLRSLSVFYMAAASTFAVAATLADHPAWNSAAHVGAHFAGKQGAAAAVALDEYIVQPGWTLTKAGAVAFFNFAADRFGMLPERVARNEAKKKSVTVAQTKHASPKPQDVIVLPTTVASARPKKEFTPLPATRFAPVLRPPIIESAPVAQSQKSMAAASAPKFTIAPQVEKAPIIARAMPSIPAVDDHPPSQAELALVTQHFRSSLTREMLANFELFLYVSKADRGAAAQRMYVFQKQDSGDLVLLYNWPVSTGRELEEIAANGQREPTVTPAGYYEIDPHRMYVSHFSGQWHQPMPYAMFFNWEDHGYMTGLAIHAASGQDISLLGERASAGCIHLAPQNARVLFTLIKNDYKGLMPKFAYDKRTATMSNQGVLVHSTDGRLEMTEGYKVLVFIENYGGENVVAALF